MFNKFFRIFSPRIVLLLCFIFSASGLAFAMYSQIIDGVEPCPLCIAQRIAYFIICIISLIGAIQGPKKIASYFYGIFILAIAGIGTAMAHHHVYLQSLPPEEWPMSCGMPLEVLFKQMPLTGFLHTVLSGTAECAMIDWTVFGISGPKISMYGFILLSLAGLYILFQQLISKK